MTRMAQRCVGVVVGVVVVALVHGGACTPYPDNAVGCDDDCPDGYVCATRNEADGARCLIAGCGDGVRTDGEVCDDGNVANDLDACVVVVDDDGGRVCEDVSFSFDEARAFGFGAGGVDALTVALGRPTLVAANDRELFVVTAGKNVVGRIGLGRECDFVDDNGDIAQRQCFGTVAGNGSMLSITTVARDSPPNEIVAVFGRAIALDGVGNAFISDVQNNIILRLDAVTGRATTIVGTGAAVVGIDNVEGTAQGIRQPEAIDVDDDGNVLFIDRDGDNRQRVRRWDRDSLIVTTLLAPAALPNAELVGAGNGRRAWAMSAARAPTAQGAIPRDLVEFDTVDGTIQRRAVLLSDPNPDENNPDCPPPNSAQPTLLVDETDPDTLYWLNDGRIITATVDPLGDVACTPSVGVALQPIEGFEFKPTNLTRSGDRFFIADPAAGAVWLLQKTADGFAAPVRFAGGEDTRPPPPNLGLSLLGDIAFDIARSSDGAASVDLAPPGDDQCRGSDDFARLEFALASSVLNRVALIDCGDGIRVVGDGRFASVDGTFSSSSIRRPIAAVRSPRRRDADGNNEFFVLESEGALRRVRFAAEEVDGDVTTVLELRGRGGGLAHDGRVLLATLPDEDRIVTIDPATFATADFDGFDDLAGPTGIQYFSLTPFAADLDDTLQNLAVVLVAEERAHRVRLQLINEVTGLPVFQEAVVLAGTGVAGDADDIDDDPEVTSELRAPRAVMFQVPATDDFQAMRMMVVDGIDRMREIEVTLDLNLATRVRTLTARDDAGVGLLARDDGPVGALRTPTALAPLGSGFLVLDQLNGRLRIVDVDDTPTATTAITVFSDSSGRALAVNAAQTEALVTNGTSQVLVVDLQGAPQAWSVTAFDVDGAVGLAGVAYVDVDDDGADEVVFADAGGHQVLITARSDFSVVDVVGRAGARGFNDGDVAGALFNEPEGVAVDGAVIYVADTGNNRVRQIRDGRVRTVLGDGEEGNGGTGSPASGFPVARPTAVTVDGRGNVLVAAGNAVRAIFVGDRGVAAKPYGVGEFEPDEAATLFGEAPRATFPEPITRCIADLALRAPPGGGPPDLFVIDSCAGLLFELKRGQGG
jgi:DNA-binding beta-propeller fold protein YncE